jgi:hypothetical protein
MRGGSVVVVYWKVIDYRGEDNVILLLLMYPVVSLS